MVQHLPEGAQRRSTIPRIVVKKTDMSEDMQRVAVELSLCALSKYELERDMARFLKTQFDQRFQPTWHCVVGKHFGSFVTSETSTHIYFYLDNIAVLLFRSGNVMPTSN